MLLPESISIRPVFAELPLDDLEGLARLNRAFNQVQTTAQQLRARLAVTVYITQVVDTNEGLELFAALKQAVNVVWEKRAELVAVTAKKRAPRYLDIWELLPRTNCKQCGEASCLAFAVAVLQHNRLLSECAPLQIRPVLCRPQGDPVGDDMTIYSLMLRSSLVPQHSCCRAGRDIAN